MESREIIIKISNSTNRAELDGSFIPGILLKKPPDLFIKKCLRVI